MTTTSLGQINIVTSTTGNTAVVSYPVYNPQDQTISYQTMSLMTGIPGNVLTEANISNNPGETSRTRVPSSFIFQQELAKKLNGLPTLGSWGDAVDSQSLQIGTLREATTEESDLMGDATWLAFVVTAGTDNRAVLAPIADYTKMRDLAQWDADLDSLKSELEAEIQSAKTELEQSITTLETDLEQQIATAVTNMTAAIDTALTNFIATAHTWTADQTLSASVILGNNRELMGTLPTGEQYPIASLKSTEIGEASESSNIEIGSDMVHLNLNTDDLISVDTYSGSHTVAYQDWATGQFAVVNGQNTFTETNAFTAGMTATDINAQTIQIGAGANQIGLDESSMMISQMIDGVEQNLNLSATSMSFSANGDNRMTFDSETARLETAGVMSVLGTPTQPNDLARLQDVPQVLDSVTSTSTSSASSAYAAKRAYDTAVAAQQAADLKVNRSGDTMTGPLMLSGGPTEPMMAVNKDYVDTAIAESSQSAFNFGGFISTTEPPIDGTLEPNNLWYQPAEVEDMPDTSFPWAVRRFNGTSWSTETTLHTPVVMETWANIDTQNVFFYAGNSWHQLDFSGSTFNETQFAVQQGLVSLRDGGITNAQIASNAMIANTKIAGLGTSSTANTGISPGNVPVLDANGDLNQTVIPREFTGDATFVLHGTDATDPNNQISNTGLDIYQTDANGASYHTVITPTLFETYTTTSSTGPQERGFQVFNNGSVTARGAVSVLTAPTQGTHVVRLQELQPIADEVGNKISGIQMSNTDEVPELGTGLIYSGYDESRGISIWTYDDTGGNWGVDVQVTNPAVLRSQLGLGTAALVNTGTAPGNVVALNGQRQLPASVIPKQYDQGTAFILTGNDTNDPLTRISNTGIEISEESIFGDGIKTTITDGSIRGFTYTGSSQQTLWLLDTSGNLTLSGGITTGTNITIGGTPTAANHAARLSDVQASVADATINVGSYPTKTLNVQSAANSGITIGTGSASRTTNVTFDIDVSAMRSKLGLGTAALVNAGQSANNALQLNANGGYNLSFAEGTTISVESYGINLFGSSIGEGDVNIGYGTFTVRDSGESPVFSVDHSAEDAQVAVFGNFNVTASASVQSLDINLTSGKLIGLSSSTSSGTSSLVVGGVQYPTILNSSQQLQVRTPSGLSNVPTEQDVIRKVSRQDQIGDFVNAPELTIYQNSNQYLVMGADLGSQLIINLPFNSYTADATVLDAEITILQSTGEFGTIQVLGTSGSLNAQMDFNLVGLNIDPSRWYMLKLRVLFLDGNPALAFITSLGQGDIS